MSERPEDHNTDSEECWCMPDVEVLKDGARVIIHRDVDAPPTGKEQ